MSVEVLVDVVGDGTDPVRLDALARQLAEDLRRVAPLRVRPATGPAAAGSKSPTLQQVGAFLISGVFSAVTVRAVRDVVLAFLDRAKAREVHVKVGDREVTVTGASRAELAALTSQLDELLLPAAAVAGSPAPSAGEAGGPAAGGSDEHVAGSAS